MSEPRRLQPSHWKTAAVRGNDVGKPYRHVHDKIGLMLMAIDQDPGVLESAILKMAETHPTQTLDALLFAIEED